MFSFPSITRNPVISLAFSVESMSQSEAHETGHNLICDKGSKQDVANKPGTQPISFVSTGAGCKKASACALFKAGLWTPACSWGTAGREVNWPSAREKIPRKESKCTYCSQRLWGLHMGNSNIRCHALMHNLTSCKLNEHIWIQKTSVLKDFWLTLSLSAPTIPQGLHCTMTWFSFLWINKGN